MNGSLFTDADPPVFVDGIGPPLAQIEEDYRRSLAQDWAKPWPSSVSRDVLALLAEVKRLRSYVSMVAAGLPREQLLEIEREFTRG